MKAVVYQAPFSIAAENVPDPELQHPNDGIVQDHPIQYPLVSVARTCTCTRGGRQRCPATRPGRGGEPAKLIDANRQIWLTRDNSTSGSEVHPDGDGLLGTPEVGKVPAVLMAPAGLGPSQRNRPLFPWRWHRNPTNLTNEQLPQAAGLAIDPVNEPHHFT